MRISNHTKGCNGERVINIISATIINMRKKEAKDISFNKEDLLER